MPRPWTSQPTDAASKVATSAGIASISPRGGWPGAWPMRRRRRAEPIARRQDLRFPSAPRHDVEPSDTSDLASVELWKSSLATSPLTMPAHQDGCAGGGPSTPRLSPSQSLERSFMRIYKLRPYQDHLVAAYDPNEDTLMEQPTGSGKTLAIVTIVGRLLGPEGRPFDNILIAAPQQQIEAGFVHRPFDAVRLGDGRAVELPKGLLRAARAERGGSVDSIRSYLESPSGHALVTTHAALVRPIGLPEDCKRKLLIIDEAHHWPSRSMQVVVHEWRRRGGRVLFATATPFRADGLEVHQEGVRVIRRSLAQHMSEGFAPRRLESSIQPVGEGNVLVTPRQVRGEEPPDPAQVEAIDDALVENWERDGRPKAIVRLPPISGGSGAFVAGVISQFVARGARVLDATGTDPRDKRRVLDALSSEREATFQQSEIDVVVGIQRVLEGTDWPHCSTVYCLGLPGSLTTIMQLLGRATRKKGKRYPMPHRERAAIRFLVPVGDRSVFDRLDKAHTRHALLTCAFLADAEFGLEWVLEQSLPAASGEVRHASPKERSEVLLAVTAAIDRLKAEGIEPTTAAVVELARRQSPSADYGLLTKIIAESLLRGEKDGHVRRRLNGLLKQRMRVRPEIRQSLRAVFDSLLEEFRNETLTDLAVFGRIRIQAHALTGRSLGEWAGRLRHARPTTLEIEQVLTLMREHLERAGTIPTRRSGPIEGLSGWTWVMLDVALRDGRIDGTGKTSLPRLAAEHFDHRNVGELPPLTIDLILDKMRDFQRSHGRFPNCNDGLVEGMSGDTWKNWNASLQKGYRGLRKGSTLARLRKEHLGDRNRSDLSPLSETFIVECMKFYKMRHGRLPTAQSGPVEGMLGETWLNWDFALRDGYRDLPGESSLAMLKEKHFKD